MKTTTRYALRDFEYDMRKALMSTDVLDVRKHRWWGWVPIAAVAWHAAYTVLSLDPQYLLFVCYTANLLLGAGIVIRSGLLVGAGFGWTLVALPLWFHSAVLNNDWELSGILFHICGPIVGAMGIRRYRLPKHTWVFAMTVGILLQLLARVFTDESLNINAAYRVYDGWEGVFSNYTVYFFSMLVGFSAFFICLTVAGNRYLYKERKRL